MPTKAVGKQVGISSKRLRPLLVAIRGMHVQAALDSLRFQPGPTAATVAAILKSAAANAENNDAKDPTHLTVVRAYADKAVVLRRFRAKSRGRVGHVRRPASHVTIVVDEHKH
jgi:large subunit ribosomal protein L22